MIYLVDEEYYEMSHSYKMIKILEDQECFDYKHIVLKKTKYQTDQIKKIILNLLEIVQPDDIVLCSWLYKSKDLNILDNLISNLAKSCVLIAPTGNNKDDMQKYIPCRCKNVLKAACLNKSGQPAGFNNYNLGNDVYWIVGTNYKISKDIYETGTCVSSTLLACFFYNFFLSNKKAHSKKIYEFIKQYNKKKINTYINRNKKNDAK